MLTGLAGRRALVTGASGGLGWSTASALAAEGAEVTIVARSAERLAAAADRIRAVTPDAVVHTLVADVADTAGIDSWRQRDGAAASAAEQLMTLAGQARERNRVNGQLIALHLQKTQEALAALTGGDARRQTYGRDGQTEPAKTGYRLIDSA